MPRTKWNQGTKPITTYVAPEIGERVRQEATARYYSVGSYLRYWLEQQVDALAPVTKVDPHWPRFMVPHGTRQSHQLGFSLSTAVYDRYNATAGSRGESLSHFIALCLEANIDELAPERAA